MSWSPLLVVHKLNVTVAIKSRVLFEAWLAIEIPRKFINKTNKRIPSNTRVYSENNTLYCSLILGVRDKLTRTLKTRYHLHIAFCNEQTLMDEGSQKITARWLHQYESEIVCLSEMRLLKSSSQKVKSLVKKISPSNITMDRVLELSHTVWKLRWKSVLICSPCLIAYVTLVTSTASIQLEPHPIRRCLI